jgi:hypothetical protein
MFGTYADFGGNSVLDYFRPITNETRNHENFAMPRYILGRAFAGECVAIFDLLLDADKEMQTFYEQSEHEPNDAFTRKQAEVYMTQILTRLREERLPDSARLALRFQLIGDERINSPTVVESNHHVMVLNLQNERCAESHYLTFAFVKAPPEA